MAYDDFQGSGYILLQPLSSENAYVFSFPSAVAEGEKGALPYGEVISTVAVSAYNTDTDADVSGVMIDNVSVYGDDVAVALSYPGAAGPYKLQFKITCTSGSIYEKDFNRVTAEDL
jgi:hypothetical protein